MIKAKYILSFIFVSILLLPACDQDTTLTNLDETFFSENPKGYLTLQTHIDKIHPDDKLWVYIDEKEEGHFWFSEGYGLYGFEIMIEPGTHLAQAYISNQWQENRVLVHQKNFTVSTARKNAHTFSIDTEVLHPDDYDGIPSDWLIPLHQAAFSDDSEGWPLLDNSSIQTQVARGSYEINNLSSDEQSLQVSVPALQEQVNFQLTAELNWGSNTDFSLGLGSDQANQVKLWFYWLRYHNRLEMRMQKDNNDTWDTIYGGYPRILSTYTFRIRYFDGTLFLFVNEELLSQTEMETYHFNQLFMSFTGKGILRVNEIKLDTF